MGLKQFVWTNRPLFPADTCRECESVHLMLWWRACLLRWNGTLRMASSEWQCNPHYSERFILLICITDIKDLDENRTSLTTSRKPCD